MTMPWENNNNSNSWSSEEEKELEALFAQEEQENQEEQPENTLEDNSENDGLKQAFSSQEDENSTGNNNQDDVAGLDQDEPASLDEVEKEITESSVKRSQTTPQFSERDVYRIVNLTSVLGVLDKTQSTWVDTIFGISHNADDIKRAVRIVSMDSDEVEDKIKPVEALQSLYEVHQETDTSKIIENLLASIKIIDDLSTNDQSSLVSLMRKMAKTHAEDNDGKVVPVRVTRNSSSAEIVDAMKRLVEENPAVSESIGLLSQCIDVIKTALK